MKILALDRTREIGPSRNGERASVHKRGRGGIGFTFGPDRACPRKRTLMTESNGPAVATLLNNVSDFMRQQLPALVRAGSIHASAKDNVVTHGVGPGAHSFGRRGRDRVCMNAHGTHIVSQAMGKLGLQDRVVAG